MSFRLLVAVGLLFVVCGCEKGTLQLYDVSGTVKNADGSIPTGEMASITFSPLVMEQGLKGASGTIQADGSFELMTLAPGDGAVAGDYVVTLNITEGYPSPKSLVPDRYSKARETPLKATVEPNNKNHFDFVIEAQ